MAASNSRKRFIKIKTAVIFGVAFLFVVLLSRHFPIILIGLFFLLATAGLKEYLTILPVPVPNIAFYFLLWLLMLTPFSEGYTWPFVLFLLLFFPFLWFYASRFEVPPLQKIATALFGVLYMSLFSFPIRLYLKQGGLPILILVLTLTWVTDVAAYFCGLRWGRRTVFKKLSPQKTLEGSLAGLTAAPLYAILYRFGSGLFFPQLHGYPMFALLGFIVGVAAQLGDLFESAIKRQAGVKDTSSLLPEHGGILDRFDSFLFASVFADAFIAFWR